MIDMLLSTAVVPNSIIVVPNQSSVEYSNLQATVESICAKQDNLSLKLELHSVKQDHSFSSMEATTKELAHKLNATEKRFEVLEGAITRLESTITHVQRKQDQIVCKQDQIFSSQDQIQSTLCGGMPPVTFKSPSSFVSWSPRSRTPLVHHGLYQSQNVEQPLNADQSLNVEQPLYNPYGVESISSLISSDPDLQSILEGFTQDDHVTIDLTLSQPLSSNPAVHVEAPLSSSATKQSVTDGSHPHESTLNTGGQPQVTGQLPNTGSQKQESSCVGQLPDTGQPQVASCQPLVPNTSGMAQAVSSQPQLPKSGGQPQAVICPDLNIGGQPQTSKQFPVDPQSVIKGNADCRNLEKVGKLGCALAVYSFFGDEVLQRSTLHGKGKLPGLDKEILARLTNTIRALPEFSFMDIDRFNNTVRKSIYKCITHRCKYLRSKSGMSD